MNAIGSPQQRARVSGALYLIIFAAGLFAEFFVRDRLIVYGDGTVTATNILAHELLYRSGGAALLITVACEPAVALLFYELLKPVSRSVSLLAAFFRLVYAAMNGVNQLLHFIPLVLLGAGVASFETDQLRGLALVSLDVYAQGLWITLIFFGLHCVLVGYLIWSSAFLPRTLGLLMAIAGACYLTHSFARLVVPAFAVRLFPYIIVPGFVAELALTLWLLVRGVNVQRWNEQAGAVAAP
jgi:hypothetical protein